jgi:hypothetical protein
MPVDRAFQIRIVTEPAAPNTVPAIRPVVTAALGPGWRAQRLVPRGPLVVIIGRSEHPVATREHARQSHEAALALWETGRFTRVEADVPVRVYAEEENVEDVAGAFAPALDWVQTTVRWPEAMAAMAPAVRGGRGIRIGQPDTGYTLHPNVGAAGLDLTTDRDVIDSDDNALDDLEQHPLWPLPFPGHGTSTSSVIIGHGPAAEGITGLTPEARLVPVRATESVVQLFDTDVAKAVEHARRVGCHVITMSLGGKGFFGLEREIQRAVDSGIIVMAAAGNHVGFVTAPASYGNCIAVAATGPGDVPWDGSSHGVAVNVSMPGSQVYNARYTDVKQPIVGLGNGTSFAVAHLAAAAGLWLAHHGRARLITRYQARNLQRAFLAALRLPGVCVIPATGWKQGFGLGRVDIAALLAAPLPALGDLQETGAFGDDISDAATRIAAAVDADPVVVRTQLGILLEEPDPARLQELLTRHEGELVYLAYSDPAFVESVTRPGDAGAFAPEIDTSSVSGRLGRRLSG